MKYLVLLLCISLSASEHGHHGHHTRHSSHEDLEKAIVEIRQEIKQKPMCRLTKPRVAAITTILSAAITAGITVATLYSKCQS